MNDLREMILQAQQSQEAKRQAREAEEQRQHEEAVANMVGRLRALIEEKLPALADQMQYRYGTNFCYSHSTEFAALPIDGYEFHFHHGYIDCDYRLKCAVCVSNPHDEEASFHRWKLWETGYPKKEGPLQELVLAWIGQTLADIETTAEEWAEKASQRRPSLTQRSALPPLKTKEAE
jgi:hypothetical protein